MWILGVFVFLLCFIDIFILLCVNGCIQRFNVFFFSVEFSACFGFSVCVCVCFGDFVSVLVIISLYLPEKIFFRGLSWNVLGKSFFA